MFQTILAYMTIAGRNRILVFGICIAALMMAGNISCCITIVAHNLLAEMSAAPESAFRLLRLPFFAYNNYAVMVGIASLPLTSLLLLVFIFFLFEKTHALEISFFSLFIFLFSFSYFSNSSKKDRKTDYFLFSVWRLLSAFNIESFCP